MKNENKNMSIVSLIVTQLTIELLVGTATSRIVLISDEEDLTGVSFHLTVASQNFM